LICLRRSSRASCEESVVGGVPSRDESWLGVTGWYARIALCTAKSLGLSLRRVIDESKRSFVNCPRM
jgi:hypothetical protein